MDIQTLTLNADQIDLLPAELLLQLLGGKAGLAARSHDLGCTASHTAEWRDAGGKAWLLPCYLLRVASRAVLWSDTDEAGVDDVSVVDTYEDPDDLRLQVEEWATELARILG